MRQSGNAPLSTANALQATREKCDELANLARAARDLSQVFVDVESLVNSQGEILNDIGSHVASTREQVKRGHDQLLQASRARSACCWRWAALILILVIIALVLFLIFDHIGKKKASTGLATWEKVDHKSSNTWWSQLLYDPAPVLLRLQ
mmetsp:Transcript_11875/g.27383  ORF Transcript_11875/g.27383 Transcript_11875/m.27383 type:complete len:149 (+) Transcript_11875:3-449(+)